MSGMRLKDELKQRALAAGFDLIGVAPATPGGDLEFAREWTERGFAGEMHYLAHLRRFDPQSVLPGVKSVICVALVYDTPFPYTTDVGGKQESGVRNQQPVFSGQLSVQTPNKQQAPAASQTSPTGRGCPDSIGAGEGEGTHAWISRYAWGRDYHEIVREKLERLRASIEELALGVETRVYVDTGPVLERAFARFSGLGWMGKNTCIINEEKGSWFFLGVILTNLQLEHDMPAPDRCGTCRACLDACPTGALIEPYKMDASRCISYLTIELKNSIPLELRHDIGVNIFGCDICQDVCPWNGNGRIQKSEVRSQENAFRPLRINARTAEGYAMAKDERQRTNDEGLETRRTAVGVEESTDSHAPSIHKSNPQIRNHPDTRHPTPDTFSLFSPPLESLAAMTEDDFRKAFTHSPIKRAKYRGWLRNLCVAMGNSGDARLIPRLQELARHPDPVIREHAGWALEQIGNCTGRSAKGTGKASFD